MRSIFFYRMPCFAEQRSYDSFATITFWSLPRLHASDGCIQSFGSKSTWFLPGTTVLVLAAQVPQQSFCFWTDVLASAITPTATWTMSLSQPLLVCWISFFLNSKLHSTFQCFQHVRGEIFVRVAWDEHVCHCLFACLCVCVSSSFLACQCQWLQTWNPLHMLWLCLWVLRLVAVGHQKLLIGHTKMNWSSCNQCVKIHLKFQIFHHGTIAWAANRIIDKSADKSNTLWIAKIVLGMSCATLEINFKVDQVKQNEWPNSKASPIHSIVFELFLRMLLCK